MSRTSSASSNVSPSSAATPPRSSLLSQTVVLVPGPATLERLRVDRQLEEALTHGPDPLHLATVFGLDDKTAIRYANAVLQVLETRSRMARRHQLR